MSKAAINMFTKCMATELGPKGIRVNAIGPGVVRTNISKANGFTDEEYDQFLDSFAQKYPLGRIGDPGDIANTVGYLASSQANFITGAIVAVDGGDLVV
ncbi:unnamed protein product [Oppiella nova]|uniref:Uncharacterized protein n=1 Tax=Oppiella nova TaxID=334625 RepID=A0A7R9QXT1_9ACAR|nr:unnamed protein product [Oppiella nova]CAG2178026.1 unnamed protein product [Oppiella nova]